MPSIRKRIGYLPSVNAQEMITKISNNENLSQSKVVGLLVEEALTARGDFNIQNKRNFVRKNLYENEYNKVNSSLQNNDLDELISDKGTYYNTKKYNNYSDYNLSKSKENFNEELFEQFKQFILFQKMIQDK